MSRWKRLRRSLVRLLPPVLLAVAVATPAAQAAQPSVRDAGKCFIVATQHWGNREVVSPEVMHLTDLGYRTSRKYDRTYRFGYMWIEYNLARLPGLGTYWQQRSVRAWYDEGTVRCQWTNTYHEHGQGHAPLNGKYLG